jgi:hypothetical protein
MQQATTTGLPEEVQKKIAEVTAQTESEVPVVPKEMNLIEIAGTVNEIAEDSSYIVVNETTFITNSDFLTNNPIKLGDRVVVTAALTDNGMEAIGVNPAGRGVAEISPETEQEDVEEIESEDYISDDAQEDNSSQEVPVEEMDSEDISE